VCSDYHRRTHLALYVLGGWLHGPSAAAEVEREFLIDNLQVRVHLIIVMIRWTGLAPWEFEFHFR